MNIVSNLNFLKKKNELSKSSKLFIKKILLHVNNGSDFFLKTQKMMHQNSDFTKCNYFVEFLFKLITLTDDEELKNSVSSLIKVKINANYTVKAGDLLILNYLNNCNLIFINLFQMEYVTCRTNNLLNNSFDKGDVSFIQFLNQDLIIFWLTDNQKNKKCLFNVFLNLKNLKNFWLTFDNTIKLNFKKKFLIDSYDVNKKKSNIKIYNASLNFFYNDLIKMLNNNSSNFIRSDINFEIKLKKQELNDDILNHFNFIFFLRIKQKVSISSNFFKNNLNDDSFFFINNIDSNENKKKKENQYLKITPDKDNSFNSQITLIYKKKKDNVSINKIQNSSIGFEKKNLLKLDYPKLKENEFNDTNHESDFTQNSSLKKKDFKSNTKFTENCFDDVLDLYQINSLTKKNRTFKSDNFITKNQNTKVKDNDCLGSKICVKDSQMSEINCNEIIVDSRRLNAEKKNLDFANLENITTSEKNDSLSLFCTVSNVPESLATEKSDKFNQKCYLDTEPDSEELLIKSDLFNNSFKSNEKKIISIKGIEYQKKSKSVTNVSETDFSNNKIVTVDQSSCELSKSFLNNNDVQDVNSLKSTFHSYDSKISDENKKFYDSIQNSLAMISQNILFKIKDLEKKIILKELEIQNDLKDQFQKIELNYKKKLECLKCFYDLESEKIFKN